MIVKNVEKNEKNSVTLVVEVTQEEFEEATDRAYQKNKKNITVQGFRKGKAPRVVIEGMYGSNVFFEDAVEEISPKAFDFAVESEKLEAVGRPSCTDAQVGDDKEVTLTFETAVYPEVALGQYKGLEVPKAEIVVTDEDVDNYLEDTRKRNGRQTAVERPAKLGDTVDIDFEGFLDGVAFDGGKGEGHKLELGSGQFIPGFEERVAGMSAGEEGEFDITFPEDYQSAELAGKATVFKVKINEVVETELPEVDDEFAKDVSEFDALSEYREAIMEELKTNREKAVNQDFSYAVLEKAVGNMSCEVPEVMTEERVSRMMSEYERNFMAQGMRLEEYMRMTGMTPDSFTAMLHPQAEQQLKTEILLRAVVEAEDIQVTEEELDKSIQEIAESYNISVEQLKKAVTAEVMEDDMKKKKANDLIVESAVAIDMPPTEEK